MTETVYTAAMFAHQTEKVFLDGIDITADCAAFAIQGGSIERGPGWADLWEHDANGVPMLTGKGDDREFVSVRRYGFITVEWKEEEQGTMSHKTPEPTTVVPESKRLLELCPECRRYGIPSAHFNSCTVCANQRQKGERQMKKETNVTNVTNSSPVIRIRWSLFLAGFMWIQVALLAWLLVFSKVETKPAGYIWIVFLAVALLASMQPAGGVTPAKKKNGK